MCFFYSSSENWISGCGFYTHHSTDWQQQNTFKPNFSGGRGPGKLLQADMRTWGSWLGT